MQEKFSAPAGLASTSAREQFGQFLIEGMACGRPPVATRSPGASSIIDDGETGWLVDPDDEVAFADALGEAVQCPAERERRGLAARAAVCERFTWSGVSGRLAEVLAEGARGVRRDAPAI